MVRMPIPVYAEAQYRIRSKFDEHGRVMFLAECPRRILWGWKVVNGAIWRFSRDTALADISRDRNRHCWERYPETVEEIFDRDIPEWGGDQSRPPKPPRP